MSNIVLVDTDVVSFLFKGDTRAELYREHLRRKRPAVSFMTMAELNLWTLKRNWAEKRKAQLSHFLLSYAVFPYNQDLCQIWAQVTNQSQRKGMPIECGDAWIAATAILYNLPLATYNVKDYAGVDGLEILPI